MTQDFSQLSLKINQIKDKTDIYISNYFANLKPESADLLKAMSYSVVDRGKRLRPALIFLTSKPFGLDDKTCLTLSLCVEMAHAYSLIHDDLPCLDNEQQRSGKPCSHIVFGEAMALLAGNSLLTLCFEVLAGPSLNLDDGKKLKIIHTFAKAFGHCGVMGGQVLDVEIAKNGGKNLTREELFKMQSLKTGEFFAFCTSLGAMLCGSKKDYDAYKQYGHALGKIYQIVDDVLDAGQDDANSVLSFFASADDALQFAKSIANDACKDIKQEHLSDFLHYIITLAKPAN
jgi:geranylgeranyl pyrophosphate synthase